MTQSQTWLGALLAVQLLLTGGLFYHDQSRQTQNQQQTNLLDFDKTSVDKVVIADQTNSVTLNKTKTGWQFADVGELPVDSAKLEQMLTSLSELKSGWPVATTTASHDQFEVSDKKNQRTIKLLAGDTSVVDLYLGSSPGLRKTHLRKAGDDDVFAAAINLFDLPSQSESWLDKGVLAVADPSAIQGKDFAIERSGTEWTFERPDNGVSPNPRAVQDLLSVLSGLRVGGTADLEPTPDAMSLVVTVEGKPLAYKLWKADEQCYIRRSDVSQSFRLATTTYENLLAIDRAKLSEDKPEPDATPAASPSSSGS